MAEEENHANIESVMPKLNRILETALYADDLDRAREFYSRVLELKPMLETDTLTAYDVGGQSVLLVFRRGGSMKTQRVPGPAGLADGEIPPHDGSGPLHMCFAVEAKELGAWEERLHQHNIPIEGRVRWQRGGESVYFRDPDNHLLELMTPGNWPIY